MRAHGHEVALEQQIQEWRSYVGRQRAIEAADLAELEDHLREQIEALVDSGLSNDEAFLVAARRMGNLDAISRVNISLFDAAADARGIDVPFAVVAHEVAHQFQPALAQVEGRGLLSEAFAWYAAFGVIEQEYGMEHLQRFLGMMRQAYDEPRSRAGAPLLFASDWFESYRRGPFALYALQEYVGREKVDLAWRRLIDAHRSGEPPFATSLDLYRELQTVTPDTLHGLLGDLFERNTFWDLDTSGMTVRPTGDGRWRVTLDVSARKIVVDEEGRETEVPMDDPIELAVYARSTNGPGRGAPLYLQMLRVRSGVQQFTVEVSEEPAEAAVDPRGLLTGPRYLGHCAPDSFGLPGSSSSGSSSGSLRGEAPLRAGKQQTTEAEPVLSGLQSASNEMPVRLATPARRASRACCQWRTTTSR